MEKRDYAIDATFTYDEKTYKVEPAPNTISKCSGCVFYKPPTRTLRSECYAPNGIRCSFPDRIFKEVMDQGRSVQKKANDAKYSILGSFIGAICMGIYYVLKNNNLI